MQLSETSGIHRDSTISDEHVSEDEAYNSATMVCRMWHIFSSAAVNFGYELEGVACKTPTAGSKKELSRNSQLDRKKKEEYNGTQILIQRAAAYFIRSSRLEGKHLRQRGRMFVD